MARDSSCLRIDILNLLNRHPKHRNCVPVIRNGKSSWQPYGLYCKQHGTMLQWLSNDQIKGLKDLCGVEDERDPDFLEKQLKKMFPDE